MHEASRQPRQRRSAPAERKVRLWNLGQPLVPLVVPAPLLVRTAASAPHRRGDDFFRFSSLRKRAPRAPALPLKPAGVDSVAPQGPLPLASPSGPLPGWRRPPERAVHLFASSSLSSSGGAVPRRRRGQTPRPRRRVHIPGVGAGARRSARIAPRAPPRVDRSSGVSGVRGSPCRGDSPGTGVGSMERPSARSARAEVLTQGRTVM